MLVPDFVYTYHQSRWLSFKNVLAKYQITQMQPNQNDLENYMGKLLLLIATFE